MGQWLDENLVTLAQIAERRSQNAEQGTQQRQIASIRNPQSRNPQSLLAAFGYTREELLVILRPMWEEGREPIGSMGDDTPTAALSDVPRPLFHYFKQRFAEVTNPPIDSLREEMVMSLSQRLGRRACILTETPEAARLLELPSPILTDEALGSNPRCRSANQQISKLQARAGFIIHHSSFIIPLAAPSTRRGP